LGRAFLGEWQQEWNAAETTGVPDHPRNAVVADLPAMFDVATRATGSQAVSEMPLPRIHVPRADSTREPASWSLRLAIILLAAGPCADGASGQISRNQRTKSLHPRKRFRELTP